MHHILKIGTLLLFAFSSWAQAEITDVKSARLVMDMYLIYQRYITK
jgi:hypothetical protein